MQLNREITNNINQIWQRVLHLLNDEVSEISFKTWIEPLKPAIATDDNFYLIAPNDFHISYCEQFAPLIKNTLSVLTSRAFDIKFVLSKQEALDELEQKSYSGESIIPLETPEKKQAHNNSGKFNPHLSFENFIVGNSNRFAHAACVALAQNPKGNTFNPIFLYGGSGLGKTHLMHAIGNYVSEHFPEERILYVQTEQFVNEFIYTIQNNDYDSFRSKYRNCDLLLIDDIQFIAGKEQMQEEFFHTFNALYEQDSNIVITCDKPPQSLITLEERLRTRFSSGLIVDIQEPDYETRAAILRHKADVNHHNVSDEVIDYIASNITSNIRELEGAYNTVMAYSLLAGECNIDTAKEALKDIIEPKAIKQVTPDMIIDIVAQYFNISTEDILSSKRSKKVTEPRQIAMYLCREVLNMPYKKIGDAIGGKDHTTVMHACNKIEGMYKDDDPLVEDIENIRKRIDVK